MTGVPCCALSMACLNSNFGEKKDVPKSQKHPVHYNSSIPVLDSPQHAPAGDDMITREQALLLNHGERLHSSTQCDKKTIRWRVSGVCRTWKRTPNRFRVPLKYGLSSYWELTEKNNEQFHREIDCPHAPKHKQQELFSSVYDGAQNE